MASYHSSRKRLENGRWICVTCGTIFEGPYAYQDSLIHSRQSECSLSPTLPDRNTRRRNRVFRSNVESALTAETERQAAERRLQDTAASRFAERPGYTTPDDQGRWRQPRQPDKHRAVEVHKAWYNLERGMREKAHNRLDSLLDGKQSTPLSRMAYAYNVRNWPGVRAAAYDLAMDEAVRDLVREILADADAALPGSPADVASALIADLGLPQDNGGNPE